ncbi:MAG TPA: hypothetical protein VNV63_07855, partial [Nitrospiria bacterium]|nr:hypothetical protein [Nitrospiria bacterium]
MENQSDRLIEIAETLKSMWLRPKRDIPATRKLLEEARELCRMQDQNFDKLVRSGYFGIGKTQAYNILKGLSSSPKPKTSRVHRVNVIQENTVEQEDPVNPDDTVEKKPDEFDEFMERLVNALGKAMDLPEVPDIVQQVFHAVGELSDKSADWMAYTLRAIMLVDY